MGASLFIYNSRITEIENERSRTPMNEIGQIVVTPVPSGETVVYG